MFSNTSQLPKRVALHTASSTDGMCPAPDILLMLPPPRRGPPCSLWRIMRIMHGVAEALELNHKEELHQRQHMIEHLQSVRCASWGLPLGPPGRARWCAAKWLGGFDT